MPDRATPRPETCLCEYDHVGTRQTTHPQCVHHAPRPAGPDDALHNDIRDVLNRHSAENGSNTPDFILARLLLDALAAFDKAVVHRAGWYGRIDEPGLVAPSSPGAEMTREGKLRGIQRLSAAINKACGIIEMGDQRLLASDGPAGGRPPELSLAEWRELYVTLDNARKVK